MRRLLALIAAFAVAGAAAAGSAAADTRVSDGVREAAADLEAGRVQQGLARLETLAAQGDGGAATFLGEIYLFGTFGLPRDAKRGCDYSERARDLHPEATHNYAQCLYDGQGRPRDYAQARVWYRKAFDAGFQQSGCALGNMYIFGQGGPEEPEKGFALCLTAAEAGQRDAQADVGNYYLHGRGVAQDYAKARAWYLKAAEQKQRNAAFNLALMNWNGHGGPRSQTEAARWWRVAYDNGRPEAALHLGRWALAQFMAKDHSTPPDLSLLDESIAWLEKAASEADPKTQKEANEALALVRPLRQTFEAKRQ